MNVRVIGRQNPDRGTWRVVTIAPPVHVEHHNGQGIAHELATLGAELIDAFRQGPVPAALALLLVVLAIQALVVLTSVWVGR